MRWRIYRFALTTLIAGLVILLGAAETSLAQSPAARIDDALQNITTLVRQGRVGYATFWDGNKFVQCRRLAAGVMRCEAAGTLMQPSLKSVLTAEAVKRLTTLGWSLNPNFGNYRKDFAADVPTSQIAEHILKTLNDAYAANTAQLELSTKWVADVTCPPRAGFSQDLAGSVNDARSMRSVAVYDCSYTRKTQDVQPGPSAKDLIAIYGTDVTSEIQRLRLNSTRNVWTIFDAGIGYIQCMPEDKAAAIYCEAQSEQSWPALAAVLTPARLSKLKSAGYDLPGRTPNYSRNYPIGAFSDAAIAGHILTVLHDAYGYTGATKLKLKAK